MADLPLPKQVIVMRTDLGMRKGKQIAQGAHASMKVFFDRFQWLGVPDGVTGPVDALPHAILAKVDDVMVDWATNAHFTKICVRAKSEAELLEVYEKARAAGLPCALVEDRGLTEFHGQTTRTCCAIGPAMPDQIDPITGQLELL